MTTDAAMREQMVAALAEFLEIAPARASAAMHFVWEKTMDVKTSSPLSFVPDLEDSGVALAHRVQMAITDEFEGEELFPAVVVVQSREGRVGLAMTAISAEQAEQLLRLGSGALRRMIRQAS